MAPASLRLPPTRQVVAPDWPHPPAEPATVADSLEQRRPHRPCPRSALSIGRQRSSTDNHGSCPCPPTCRIRPHRAGRGSFPSSRWSHWSAVGSVRHPVSRSPAGTSGHSRQTTIAGDTASTVMALTAKQLDAGVERLGARQRPSLDRLAHTLGVASGDHRASLKGDRRWRSSLE
jgi:hypothetical protein